MLNNVRWKQTKHGVYDRIWNHINWIDLVTEINLAKKYIELFVMEIMLATDVFGCKILIKLP